MKNLVNKTVNLSLAGLDGNAYALLGAFVTQAQREKWTEKEIRTVTQEARRGDYDHLLAVLSIHCKPIEGSPSLTSSGNY